MLPGSVSGKYGSDGFEDNRAVKQQRHVLEIEQVVLELAKRIFHSGAVGIPYLGPSGEAGTRGMPLVVVEDFLAQHVHENRALRTRTHKAHVPADDIDELGKFVQPVLA